MKIDIVNRLLKKAGMAVMLCGLFFIVLTFSCCIPLEENTGQSAENDQAVQEEEAVEEQANIETESESLEEQETTEEAEEESVTEEAGPEDITINVYYSNDTAEYLIPESRIIPPDNKYIDSLNELMKKPIDDSLFPLVPDTARINSLEVIDGNAKVDFSQEFLDDRIVSDTVDILLIYSVVNTLTQFPDINSVSLYIDGEKLDLLGQIDISEPVFRRNDLIMEQQG